MAGPKPTVLPLHHISKLRKHYYFYSIKKEKICCLFPKLLGERESNPRPLGYEPSKLPLLHPLIKAHLTIGFEPMTHGLQVNFKLCCSFPYRKKISNVALTN